MGLGRVVGKSHGWQNGEVRVGDGYRFGSSLCWLRLVGHEICLDLSSFTNQASGMANPGPRPGAAP